MSAQSASHLSPSAAYNMHLYLASDAGSLQGGQPDGLALIPRNDHNLPGDG